MEQQQKNATAQNVLIFALFGKTLSASIQKCQLSSKFKVGPNLGNVRILDPHIVIENAPYLVSRGAQNSCHDFN